MDANRALTPVEVADRLQVAKNTVYELIKRGELRGYRVGNQVRVDEADLDAFRNHAPAQAFVLSGQDGLLDLLARATEQSRPGVRILRTATGSYHGLSGLYLGTIQAAAVHLWNASTGRYNADFVPSLVPGIPTVTYRLATRTVGWYVPAGNPRGVEGWQALGRRDLTLANREKGSGIRVLLDGRLSLGGLPRPQGYDTEWPSHTAVASAVARGDAAFGLGNQKTALQVQGIDFLPLQTEEYDLVIKKDDAGRAPFAALIETLRSAAFRQELQGVGGYGLDRLGEIVGQS